MSLRRSDGHEARVMELCREHGCHLARHGKGWRIAGHRVDLVYADLADVRDGDLLPAKNTARRQAGEQ